MPVMTVRANPRVAEDIGKVAVQRGPVVYCLEEPDNGKDLQRVYLSADAAFAARYEPDTLGGVVTVEADGWELAFDAWDDDALCQRGEIALVSRAPAAFHPHIMRGQTAAPRR